MLKEYDELSRCDSMGISKERALWNIARELSRKNDLLEVEMLCKTAETLKSVAKGSVDLHYEGWRLAEKLALAAHGKITNICGIQEKENDDETEGE